MNDSDRVETHVADLLQALAQAEVEYEDGGNQLHFGLALKGRPHRPFYVEVDELPRSEDMESPLILQVKEEIKQAARTRTPGTDAPSIRFAIHNECGFMSFQARCTPRVIVVPRDDVRRAVQRA